MMFFYINTFLNYLSDTSFAFVESQLKWKINNIEHCIKVISYKTRLLCLIVNDKIFIMKKP